jgi:chemotaxis methyl-accepting protein methylase
MSELPCFFLEIISTIVGVIAQITDITIINSANSACFWKVYTYNPLEIIDIATVIFEKSNMFSSWKKGFERIFMVNRNILSYFIENVKVINKK